MKSGILKKLRPMTRLSHFVFEFPYTFCNMHEDLQIVSKDIFPSL